MRIAHPDWLKLPARDYAPSARMAQVLGEHGVHTVCVHAGCPNTGECFARGTCTFMILGEICTRRCRFCGVDCGRPLPPDDDEPMRVMRAAARLGLTHVVVTSVTRDDLDDGGACHFAKTIQEVHRLRGVTVEVLVPDFGGEIALVHGVLEAEPEVFAHNVETVPRLYRRVRPGGVYQRSLDVIAAAAGGPSVSKSGLMLGLGETLQEIVEVLADLRSVGCEGVSIGQYLSPADSALAVVDYVSPSTFVALERMAYAMGFSFVTSGPLVRSSYHAKMPARATTTRGTRGGR